MQPILQLVDVHKTFQSLTAVSHVSLDLAKGEFLSFLGPSGSGKTTMLSMIAGLVATTSGRIMLDGRPIDRLPPYKRNIGVVFQNYALFPHLTVRQNVAFPLEMQRVPRKEITRRVKDILGLVGLPDHEDRLPKQLSGGQQQRVALARAMVFEPPILLMDEPLGALDKKLRENMQLEIMRLHKELSMSIIYVTHDQEEALAMSDRIAVFREGRLEQIGSPSDIYERPSNRFVADFIGEANFFEGKVKDKDDDYCIVETPIGSFRSRYGTPLSVGDLATVLIRPELVGIRKKKNGSGDSANTIPGKVSEIVYLGRMRKYVIGLSNGATAVATQQFQGAGDTEFFHDEEVCLEWSADNSTTLPGGDG